MLLFLLINAFITIENTLFIPSEILLAPWLNELGKTKELK